MSNCAIAIFGPTGIGKTSLSLKLAQSIGEVISVDSMQVYKYMDIGTAKVSKTDIQTIPHHLVDIITPDKQFSAGDFKRFCESMIPQIIERGKVPFLVGGTGFYYSTLINGIVNIPQVDDSIREKISILHEKKGQEYLYRMLSIVDREITDRIHENDPQRTCRALEVFFGTGRKLSDYYKEERVSSSTRYLKIGLNTDRAVLYQRINKRVENMFESGLIEEVKMLLSMGYTRNDPGMRAIGYKEVLDHFDGLLTFDDMIAEVKKNSRRYAKRQLTWFRSIDDVIWFDLNDEDGVTELVNSFLKGEK